MGKFGKGTALRIAEVKRKAEEELRRAKMRGKKKKKRRRKKKSSTSSTDEIPGWKSRIKPREKPSLFSGIHEAFLLEFLQRD